MFDISTHFELILPLKSSRRSYSNSMDYAQMVKTTPTFKLHNKLWWSRWFFFSSFPTTLFFHIVCAISVSVKVYHSTSTIQSSAFNKSTSCRQRHTLLQTETRTHTKRHMRKRLCTRYSTVVVGGGGRGICLKIAASVAAAASSTINIKTKGVETTVLSNNHFPTRCTVFFCSCFLGLLRHFPLVFFISLLLERVQPFHHHSLPEGLNDLDWMKKCIIRG